MFQHGSSCLAGPVSKRRTWWHVDEDFGIEESTENNTGIRTDLVARVRREIAAGTYDTPEKFEIAFDRMLRRIESEDE